MKIEQEEERVGECLKEGERVCVFMWVRERESEWVNVCVRERTAPLFSSSELDLELIRGSQLFQFSVESSII